MNRNEKSIYLTFDDGPIPEVTPWVLKTLKEFNVQATFFCIGNNIKKHPEIFKSIISEGHSIGNHTQNHLHGWRTKNEDYFEDVEECNQQIHNLTKHPTKLFRPPYGRLKLSQYKKLKTQDTRLKTKDSRLKTNYSIIMWDVLSGDFDKKTSPQQCLENVLTRTRNGSIVVFHDSVKAKENLYYTLPKFLQHFNEKGFEFKVFF